MADKVALEAFELLKSRRSVRSYTKQVPSDELVDKVLEVALSAPNAGPISVRIVKDTNLIAKMDEAVYQSMISGGGFGRERASLPGYRPFFGAPICIIFAVPQDDASLGNANASCACTAGAYAATTLGLGSCFVMAPGKAFQLIDGLGDMLRLPEGIFPFCALLLGYTDNQEKYIHPSTQEPAIVI